MKIHVKLIYLALLVFVSIVGASLYSQESKATNAAINQLPAAAAISGTDITVVTQGGSPVLARQTPISSILTYLQNTGDFILSSLSSTQTVTSTNAITLQLNNALSAGSLQLNPTTSLTGNLSIVPTSNSGNTITTITNAAFGQTTLLTIPDPGATTANFILSKTPSSQTINGILSLTGSVLSPYYASLGTLGTVTARFMGGTVSGAPLVGTFNIRDYIIDSTGAIWICTAGGSPGTWVNAGSSGDLVTSVFGRIGAVVANTGDYTAAQVTNAADKSSSSQQTFSAGIAGSGDGGSGTVMQVIAQGKTTPAQQNILGYDTVEDVGFIQSVHQDVSVTSLLIQPSGASVGVGYPTTHPFTTTFEVNGGGIFAGNLQAGLNGTAGSLASYPSVSGKGHLAITGVANLGNTVTTISNKLMNQASTIMIPDPGASGLANFILTNVGSSAQVINSNLELNGTTFVSIEAGSNFMELSSTSFFTLETKAFSFSSLAENIIATWDQVGHLISFDSTSAAPQITIGGLADPTQQLSFYYDNTANAAGLFSENSSGATPFTINASSAISTGSLVSTVQTNFLPMGSVPVPSSGANIYYFEGMLYATQPTGQSYALTGTQTASSLPLLAIAPLSSMQTTVSVNFPSNTLTAIAGVMEGTTGLPLTAKVVAVSNTAITVEVYNASPTLTATGAVVFVTATGN